ncbi:helix-turn-helix domain-containing protein [Streptomyces sp. NPDC052236]|uniref:helix-turn-helix domain-containing protein n=1 Tax=Streptomyces sp. NPDC052236 TaxID=3365686 RepID=UPI0037D70CD4
MVVDAHETLTPREIDTIAEAARAMAAQTYLEVLGTFLEPSAAPVVVARLRETLRCFREHAGSIPRTAEALQIHRTSLHYRLRQIQEITGWT